MPRWKKPAGQKERLKDMNKKEKPSQYQNQKYQYFLF
jgi:hypothetical protein